MFDLFRSRAKFVRYMLGGLLLLVAVSMVVTLIPGYGVPGNATDQVVAEVGKEAITVPEVQQVMQNAMRNRAFPAEMAQLYLPQLVDQMVGERIVSYEANRLGLEVSQDEVVRTIRTALPQLFPNGQFVGKDVYAGFLAQQNMTIAQFEANLERQLLSNKLADMVGNSVVITPAEIENDYRLRNEKVKLQYVALAPDKFRSGVSVSPDEVKKYFDQNRAQFQIPEKRSLVMLVVEEVKVAQNINVPDAELRKMYEAQKDSFRVPERVHVRHILLKTTDKPAADVPKIQARAEELLKQLKGGADFAELAKKNSEDPGSAVKGGDLGWIVKGQTVPEFETTAFSLKPNELSNIVKTQYGLHILQVLEKQEARLKPFDEVKDQLASERKRQAVFETMQRLADQAHDRLLKDPNQAEQIARDLNLQVVKVDRAGAGDPVPEFGVNPDFEAAVAGLPKGGVTQVMQAPGNKLAVAAVTQLFPARQAELPEVEGRIRDQLAAQKLAQVVNTKAQEAAKQVQSAGGDLSKIAKSLGVEVKSTQEFTRSGAADGIGSAAQLQQAFSSPVGGVFGPVQINGTYFICKVEAKNPADMSKLAAESDSIRTDLRQRKSRERMDLFIDSLKTALLKQGKVKVHQDVLNRLLEGYKG